MRPRPTSCCDVIAKLRPFCQRWGGDIIEITPLRYNRLFEYTSSAEGRRHQFDAAPATNWHGVVYDLKQVYVVPKHATANGLIHEMGHVFASELPPDDADEFSWLGWEAAMALKVGLYREWSDNNDSYGIMGYGDDWGVATAAQKAAALRASLEICFSAGIVEPGTLEPRSRR